MTLESLVLNTAFGRPAEERSDTKELRFGLEGKSVIQLDNCTVTSESGSRYGWCNERRLICQCTLQGPCGRSAVCQSLTRRSLF
jgi:hypothetical protein